MDQAVMWYYSGPWICMVLLGGLTILLLDRWDNYHWRSKVVQAAFLALASFVFMVLTLTVAIIGVVRLVS